MVIKKLSDCSKCPHMATCDAHILNGTHQHREEPNSCELVLEPDKEPDKEDLVF
jgi:hypothetical protein